MSIAITPSNIRLVGLDYENENFQTKASSRLIRNIQRLGIQKAPNQQFKIDNRLIPKQYGFRNAPHIPLPSHLEFCNLRESMQELMYSVMTKMPYHQVFGHTIVRDTSFDKCIQKVYQVALRGFHHGYKADLKDYYDTIPHDTIRHILNYFGATEMLVQTCMESLNRCGFFMRGIPQNKEISYDIASFLNLYIFDQMRHAGHTVIMFSDDTYMLASSNERLLTSVADWRALICKLGLTENRLKFREITGAEFEQRIFPYDTRLMERRAKRALVTIMDQVSRKPMGKALARAYDSTLHSDAVEGNESDFEVLYESIATRGLENADHLVVNLCHGHFTKSGSLLPFDFRKEIFEKSPHLLTPYLAYLKSVISNDLAAAEVFLDVVRRFSSPSYSEAMILRWITSNFQSVAKAVVEESLWRSANNPRSIFVQQAIAEVVRIHGQEADILEVISNRKATHDRLHRLVVVETLLKFSQSRRRRFVIQSENYFDELDHYHLEIFEAAA